MALVLVDTSGQHPRKPKCPVRQFLGTTVLVLAFAAVFWWSFAARSAGTIDGSWVDGWKFRIKKDD